MWVDASCCVQGVTECVGCLCYGERQIDGWLVGWLVIRRLNKWLIGWLVGNQTVE